METPKYHLATITILVKDRKMHSEKVNQILTEYGNLIIARLGVNLERQCIEHCTAMITVAVQGEITKIKELKEKIDSLYGIVAKTNIMTE